MIFAGFGIVAALLLAIILIFLALIRSVSRERRAFFEVLKQSFDPDGKNPSLIDLKVNIASKRMAHDMAQSLKSVFMQTQSTDARATKALEGAVAQDLAAQSGGLMGAVVKSFPAVQKLIGQHPGWLPIAQKLMKGQGATISGDNGGAVVEEFDQF